MNITVAERLKNATDTVERLSEMLCAFADTGAMTEGELTQWSEIMKNYRSAQSTPVVSHKHEAFVCPVCGGSNCSFFSDELDNEGYVSKCQCNDCDAVWREYFLATYDGYEDDTGLYNAEGFCICHP